MNSSNLPTSDPPHSLSATHTNKRKRTDGSNMAWSKQTFIDPPTLKKPLALFFFLVNIFLPGVGTMLVGALSCSCETLIVGILQLLTACFVIGWVWSILWGWELFQTSRRKIKLPIDSHLGPDGLL